MKTISALPVLFALAGTAADAPLTFGIDQTGGAFSGTIQTIAPWEKPVATLNSGGVYTFAAPALLVRLTRSEIVLGVETVPRVFTSCAVWHDGKPCPDAMPRPVKERFHFKIAGGEIVLDRIETPKHIPATPERWEWEEARK